LTGVETTELLGASVEAGPPGFEITDPIVDAPLPSALGHVTADRSRAIVRIPGAATFSIEGGERIRVELEPNAPAGIVQMWQNGTVAALLLGQQGLFALHASVVDIHGVAVAVAGQRGAGKSTTALRLAQRGHELVTDDVSPLEIGVRPTVHPFARPIHVFEQTAARLGLDMSGAQPPLPSRPKHALPARDGSPVELAAMAVLRPQPMAAIESLPVLGTQAYRLVVENVYRYPLLVTLWEAELFAWTGAVAAAVPVHVLARPTDGWTVDSVAAAVERIADACWHRCRSQSGS
jgi:hypothetical protein